MQKRIQFPENPNISQMDLQYTPTYLQAKSNVVYFHHSELKMATIKGVDSLDFLNRISTNEVRNLKDNESIQTILTSDKGRIIDVVTLVSLENNELLLLSSNSSIVPTLQWMKKYIIMDDVKTKEHLFYEAIELHGPSSISFVNEFFSLQHSDFSFQKIIIHEDTGTIIVRIPSISEISILLLIPKVNETIIPLLTSTLLPLTDFDRELLRIESGMGKSPNEYNEKYNPLEAGLLHIINFKKGCYIGQEVIARLDSYNKVKQRLFGIHSLVDLQVDDKIMIEYSEVGRITSVLKLPDTSTIGLCYVRGEFAHDNTKVNIRSEENNNTSALLKKLPMTNE